MRNYVLLVLCAACLNWGQTLSLLNPGGGETYIAGQSVSIQWTPHNDATSGIYLEYSLNNGAYWKKIASDIGNSGSFVWVAPYLQNAATNIRVKVAYSGTVTPASSQSGTFSIAAAAPDAYEPNNSLSEAYSITIGDTLKNAILDGDAFIIDSMNGEKDYYKISLEEGNLVSIGTLPELYNSQTSRYTFNDGDEPPRILLFNSEKSNVPIASSDAGILHYPVKKTGVYYILIAASQKYLAQDTKGWYRYGLNVSTTPLDMVDLVSVVCDSQWIDSLQAFYYKADVTGFASGISMHLELLSKPGGNIITTMASTFPPVPNPASKESIKAIVLEASNMNNSQILRADISIPYDESALLPGRENTLSAWYFNETSGTWEAVDYSLDVAANKITIHTNHFSLYGIFVDVVTENETASISSSASEKLVVSPNPVNPAVSFFFSTSGRSAVDVGIFNLQGRKITSLISGNVLPKGTHSINWNGSTFASGVYLVRMTEGKNTFQKRFCLVR